MTVIRVKLQDAVVVESERLAPGTVIAIPAELIQQALLGSNMDRADKMIRTGAIHKKG